MELEQIDHPPIVLAGRVKPCSDGTTKKKQISISKNRAGREAFMNNAAVDNFGTKEYHNCIFGDVMVKLDWPMVTLTKPVAKNSSSYLPALLEAPIANALSSSTKTQQPLVSAGQCPETSVMLYCSKGRKPNKVSTKICPDLSSNWISEEVVRRCRLDPIHRETAKQAVYKGTLLSSTGELIRFICPGKYCSHRFHVARDTPFPFEMLCGAEFVRTADEEEHALGT